MTQRYSALLASLFAGLLLTTAIYTGIYVFRKNRADEAFLAAATSDEQP